MNIFTLKTDLPHKLNPVLAHRINIKQAYISISICEMSVHLTQLRYRLTAS